MVLHKSSGEGCLKGFFSFLKFIEKAKTFGLEIAILAQTCCIFPFFENEYSIIFPI